MPQRPKFPNRPVNPANQSRPLHTTQPWHYQLDGDRAIITAYVEASGKSEHVLTVNPTSGASAEMLAVYFCGIINRHHNLNDALQEAKSALELVLNDGLTFSSEQAADHALAVIKKRLIGLISN